MNDLEIRKTFEIFKEPNQLVEIRIVKDKFNTWSGYFDNVDNLIKNLKRFENESCNIYFTINRITKDCSAREQYNKFLKSGQFKTTTKDSEIEAREWIFIDVDPTRITGVSASDEEKNKAREVAMKIYQYLVSFGFNQPITCDSGNGYHLMFKVAINNKTDVETKETIIKNFLKSLDMMFSTEEAKVDLSVFNPSRICKLYGTYSKKGTSTKERPHRLSKILRIPPEIKNNPLELFSKIADLLPKQETPSYKNSFNQQSFDIMGFIERNNIEVDRIVPFNGGRKFLLKECPFDESHESPDSAIFVLDNGAISFHCFHNSCQNNNWQTLRNKFEPKIIQQNKQKQRYTSKKEEIEIAKQKTEKIDEETGEIFDEETGEIKENKDKHFLMLSEIEDYDRSKIISMPSGFKELDRCLIGFNKGELTVWSGSNGSGKSSIVNQITLNTIQKGFKGAIFSGELTKGRMKHWLTLQACGRNHTIKSQFNSYDYYVPKDKKEYISKWCDEKIWIYDNYYGSKAISVLDDMTRLKIEKNIDFIIIDNLFSFDITEIQGDKYQQQTNLILKLTDMAKQLNIHIHLICHPRKTMQWLTKNDISGTADLTNAADNVIIVHRKNNSFSKNAKEHLPNDTIERLVEYDNILEVCKNRDLGFQDLFIGLHFEKESKRFLNYKTENIVYDWEDMYDWQGIPEDERPF